MIHWEEGIDERGWPAWLRYIDFSHWGLVLTGVYPRWMIPNPSYIVAVDL